METEDALIAAGTAVLIFVVLVGFDYVRGVPIAWVLDAAVALLSGGATYYVRTTSEVEE